MSVLKRVFREVNWDPRERRAERARASRRRIRNPIYACEALERKLSPSALVGTLDGGSVEVSIYGEEIPEPEPLPPTDPPPPPGPYPPVDYPTTPVEPYLPG